MKPSRCVFNFRLCLCLQASVSPSSYTLSKCFLPEESTVIGVYCTAGACLLLLFLAHCLWMKGLLQCLNLFLLGKHKSLWTALPRVHQDWAIEESVKTDDFFFFFANVTLLPWTGPEKLFIQPWFICLNVSLDCDQHEHIYIYRYIYFKCFIRTQRWLTMPGDMCQITYVSFTFLGSSRTSSYTFRKFLRTESRADTRDIDETNQYVNTQCCDFRWCSQTVDGAPTPPPPTPSNSLQSDVNCERKPAHHLALRHTIHHVRRCVRVPRFVFNSVSITYLSIFIAEFLCQMFVRVFAKIVQKKCFW